LLTENRNLGFGFRLFFDKVMPSLISVNTEVLCAPAHPPTLHTALFPLVLKTTKQLANIQTSYYVIVGTDTLLHKKNYTHKKQSLKKEEVKTENRSVLTQSRFGSVFDISVRFFGLKPNRRHH